MQLFVHLCIIIWLYIVLQYQSRKSSNFLVFHTSGGISLILAAFLFLIFVSIMFSSSLISNWLLIIFVTFGEFSNRFLKCSFHIYICSSWLAAFDFALEVLFILLTSFTVCHAIRDCLSFTKFLILLSWPWIYSIWGFWYVNVDEVLIFIIWSKCFGHLLKSIKFVS